MFSKFPPKMSTLSAVAIGYLLLDDTTANEQNALGNWLMLIAQMLCTNAYFVQLKEEKGSKSDKENKIYYNDGKNTNLLNGAIVTSGKEFFQSLGMKFKDSGRTHQVGKDKGKPILVPDIKSKEDIPEKVMGFFNESYNFLEQLVGKDNVVYAEIHFDEDTPHLHFYFMPIVSVVKRKVFETSLFNSYI